MGSKYSILDRFSIENSTGIQWKGISDKHADVSEGVSDKHVGVSEGVSDKHVGVSEGVSDKKVS